MKTSKAVLAVTLSAVMFCTSCSTSWINIALQDLPILIQIAQGVISLIPAASQDQAIVANISQQATADLNLILTLANEYKARPTPTTLAKIQDAISTAQTQLPQLLQAAHISNPKLVQQVTSAVGIILSTINAIAALLPPNQATFKASPAKLAAIPNGKDLKKAWIEQVCSGEMTCAAIVK